ncbi:unnamed protein product [Rhizoctonia solani]|uniref:Uncharacterized protein n=1 Tax=Rhizoctonia solani TaxID=456999 RepID=A0A8H3ATK6_9AGAM|nr:unnamed protein product [Rhizoctonia solani]
MGTRGFLAYRHKGKYYRVYLLNDAHPSQYVRCCMNLIPRDPARLEEWIENTGKALENERQRIRILTAEYPLEHDEASVGTTTNSPANDVFDSDDDDAQKHIWILSDSDRSWTLGATFIEWTYVFDLDDRVFTVNGTVHFRLDNMPPQQISPTGFISMQCLMSYKRVEIPYEYLKTVDSWPPPRFDTIRAELEYNELQPLIVPLSEWGVPNWEVLTVPQKLASSLVKTLIEDYTDELALAHYPSVWHKVGLFCWQVVNTAAPSHLICPPLNSTPKTSSLYAAKVHLGDTAGSEAVLSHFVQD